MVEYEDYVEETSEEAINKHFDELTLGRREKMAYVMELTITIEYYLSELIKEYFLEDNYLKLPEFKDLILDKLNFERKKQILKKLAFENRDGFEFDKKTYEDLDYVQEIRNKIAHSLKRFDNDKQVFKIEYTRGKENKQIYFDEDFIKEFHDKAIRATGNITAVHRKLELDRLNKS